MPASTLTFAWLQSTLSSLARGLFPSPSVPSLRPWVPWVTVMHRQRLA